MSKFLVSGVGGFFQTGDKPPSSIPPKSISKACHQVAMEEGWLVTDYLWSGMSQNFHSIHLKKFDSSIWVLFNAHVPLVGFCSPAPLEMGTLEHAFVAGEALNERFDRDTDFAVVPIEELRRPVTDNDYLALSSADREQAKYWRPNTVGEIIFNFWD